MNGKYKQLEAFGLFSSLCSYSKVDLDRLKFQPDSVKSIYLNEIKKHRVVYTDDQILTFIDNHIKESLLYNNVH